MANKPAWVRHCPISEFDWRIGWARINKNRLPVPAPNHDNAPSAYKRYLLSPRWQWFRGIVLILAGFRCARCENGATEVHHLTYKRLGREKLRDVEPLCRECHAAAHGWG